MQLLNEAQQCIVVAGIPVWWNFVDELVEHVLVYAFLQALRPRMEALFDALNTTSIAAKIAVWARLTEARPEPLLGCLETLQTLAPEEIAANIMEGAIEAQSAIPAAAEADIGGSAGMTADPEGLLPVLVEVA